VQYSRRFYAEVLQDPKTASPILFPETVFNAPSSHLSALLASPAANYTLVGDYHCFTDGLDLARFWLITGRAEEVLLVAAEELDWLSAEAIQLLDPTTPLTEGAVALLLGKSHKAEASEASFPIPSLGQGFVLNGAWRYLAESCL
jgi:3-oxoacyl-(acyl-carrier-protein) synthase